MKDLKKGNLYKLSPKTGWFDFYLTENRNGVLYCIDISYSHMIDKPIVSMFLGIRTSCISQYSQKPINHHSYLFLYKNQLRMVWPNEIESFVDFEEMTC